MAGRSSITLSAADQLCRTKREIRRPLRPGNHLHDRLAIVILGPLEDKQTLLRECDLLPSVSAEIVRNPIDSERLERQRVNFVHPHNSTPRWIWSMMIRRFSTLKRFVRGIRIVIDFRFAICGLPRSEIQ